MTSSVLFKLKEDCVYTSCYCEENVWHLCKAVKDNHPSCVIDCFCVFISNDDQTIPLWEQTASTRDDGLVVWDYHVIFIHKMPDGSFVYDLDTRLNFPCPFKIYLDNGVHSCESLKPQFHRMFRVISAEEFLTTFASDRSHMINEEGEWLKPPPEYSCIKTENSTNNIKDFISMDPEIGIGKVMKYRDFCEFFSENESS